MLREILKSKIHRATVTDANLSYEGSITLDPALMALADLKEFEKVQVVNLNNGERFETYCIRGKKPGNGEICVNGAASRLVQIGDLVIIMAYTWLSDEDLANFSQKIVKVTPENQPKE